MAAHRLTQSPSSFVQSSSQILSCPRRTRSIAALASRHHQRTPALVPSSTSDSNQFNCSRQVEVYRSEYRPRLAQQFGSQIRVRISLSKKRGIMKETGVTPVSDSSASDSGAANRRPRREKPFIPTPTNFDTIVLEPKEEHKATIVWLHGLGQCGSKWAEDLKNYDQLHPSIKWILPTAPLRNVDIRTEQVTAWYNATPVFKEGHFIDLEGLDNSAQRVAEFLIEETTKDGENKIKVAVGGFSQGCATALYITGCLITGKYSNGKPFPVKLDAAIALGGWLPTIKTFESETMKILDAQQRAGEVPMFFGHCEDDFIMPVWQSHASTKAFQAVGVKDLTLKTYPKGGHACIAEEANDLREWLVAKLELDGPKECDSSKFVDTSADSLHTDVGSPIIHSGHLQAELKCSEVPYDL